jgi:hypothetical protein
MNENPWFRLIRVSGHAMKFEVLDGDRRLGTIEQPVSGLWRVRCGQRHVGDARLVGEALKLLAR